MEKSWIDSEDGRDALLELSQLPNARRIIREAGAKHTQTLVMRILSANVRDPEKDRALIVDKAELEGAQGMLSYLLQLIDEADKPRKKQSPK